MSRWRIEIESELVYSLNFEGYLPEGEAGTGINSGAFAAEE